MWQFWHRRREKIADHSLRGNTKREENWMEHELNTHTQNTEYYRFLVCIFFRCLYFLKLAKERDFEKCVVCFFPSHSYSYLMSRSFFLSAVACVIVWLFQPNSVYVLMNSFLWFHYPCSVWEICVNVVVCDSWGLKIVRVQCDGYCFFFPFVKRRKKQQQQYRITQHFNGLLYLSQSLLFFLRSFSRFCCCSFRNGRLPLICWSAVIQPCCKNALHTAVQLCVVRFG